MRLQEVLFFVSLYLVAIAQSGHKPCVQAFGADQFDENDPEECIAKSSFFNWWYFCMCGGTLMTVQFLNYVQDNLSWGLGFGIPCISMIIALIVYLSGTTTYRFMTKSNEESPFVRIGRVFLVAGKNWRKKIQGGTGKSRSVEGSEQFRVLVPFARTITGKPSGITTLQRIGTGVSLSAISMITAALVEQKRLEVVSEHGLVDKPDAPVPMSIWWLIPQYSLFGVSEAFTMVGLQEFFYSQVPPELRSVGLSLYLSVFGLGNFLSSFTISIIDKLSSKYMDRSWFTDNLNQAHLDYFYWLLAGMSLVALLAFQLSTKAYIYRRSNTV
uniref:Uncharacterized protein n=1 Tax=Kalanchoe fedtschenkoi TaxID=63787 RepID=A0A7N0VMQ1_KALFE